MRIARRVIAVAAAASALVALTGCSRADHGGAEPQLQGQWVLASAEDRDGTVNLLNQNITITIAGDLTTAGRDACSDYSATVLGSSSHLWVRATQPRSVRCASSAQEALQFRYLSALNSVRSATVVGGVLTLAGPSVALQFERSLNVPMVYLVGHTWQLDTAGELDFQKRTSTVSISYLPGTTLTFKKNGTLTAETACANISAKYAQNAGQVVTTHVLVITKAACGDYDEGPQDNLTRVIDGGFSFQSGKDQMILFSPRAGFQLSFDILRGPKE